MENAINILLSEIIKCERDIKRVKGIVTPEVILFINKKKQLKKELAEAIALLQIHAK